MTFFFSGRSARKIYPSRRVVSIERNPSRVDVISQNFDTSVNPMRDETAPIHDAINLGKRKFDFVHRRSLY
jgi:predicted O-methyltransferase YrrM